MKVEDAIRASCLSEGLDEAAVSRLIQMAQTRLYKEGDFLVRQFEGDRDLFILVSGCADVLAVTGEVVGHVKTGVPFGELAMIDGKPRAATIRARSACLVALIPFDSLHAMIWDDAVVGRQLLHNLARGLSTKLRSVNQHVAMLLALGEAHGHKLDWEG